MLQHMSWDQIRLNVKCYSTGVESKPNLYLLKTLQSMPKFIEHSLVREYSSWRVFKICQNLMSTRWSGKTPVKHETVRDQRTSRNHFVQLKYFDNVWKTIGLCKVHTKSLQLCNDRSVSTHWYLLTSRNHCNQIREAFFGSRQLKVAEMDERTGDKKVKKLWTLDDHNLSQIAHSKTTQFFALVEKNGRADGN